MRKPRAGLSCCRGDTLPSTSFDHAPSHRPDRVPPRTPLQRGAATRSVRWFGGSATRFGSTLSVAQTLTATARVASPPRAVVLLDLCRRTLMKISLKNRKPRNPLVAAARFRRAGSHRSSTGTLRRQGMRALQRELDQMKHSP
jgi:hypothetical protein